MAENHSFEPPSLQPQEAKQNPQIALCSQSKAPHIINFVRGKPPSWYFKIVRCPKAMSQGLTKGDFWAGPSRLFESLRRKRDTPWRSLLTISPFFKPYCISLSLRRLRDSAQYKIVRCPKATSPGLTKGNFWAGPSRLFKSLKGKRDTPWRSLLVISPFYKPNCMSLSLRRLRNSARYKPWPP